MKYCLIEIFGYICLSILIFLLIWGIISVFKLTWKDALSTLAWMTLIGGSIIGVYYLSNHIAEL